MYPIYSESGQTTESRLNGTTWGTVRTGETLSQERGWKELGFGQNQTLGDLVSSTRRERKDPSTVNWSLPSNYVSFPPVAPRRTTVSPVLKIPSSNDLTLTTLTSFYHPDPFTDLSSSLQGRLQVTPESWGSPYVMYSWDLRPVKELKNPPWHDTYIYRVVWNKSKNCDFYGGHKLDFRHHPNNSKSNNFGYLSLIVLLPLNTSSEKDDP